MPTIFIPGYGHYKIDEDGTVFNNDTGVTIKPMVDSHGYLTIRMRIGGKRVKTYLHRALALAFIPNPDGLPEVDHRDGNKTNNRLYNLRWCTGEQNRLWAVESGLCNKKRSVQASPVDGPVGLWFPSVKAVIDNGFNIGNVYKCFNGKLNKHAGYKWERQ